MRMNSSMILVVITAFLMAMSTASDVAADWQFMSRPGTVSYTLSCADDTEVVLDTVMVERVAGSYLYVRDPWSAETLPVYAVAQFDTRWPVEITGRTATVLGTRIVIASHIRHYANQAGNPVLVMPKLAEPWNWPNMVEVPLAPVPEGDLPLPGGFCQALEQTQTMSYSLPTGEITLTDFIVTAGRGDDFTANTFYVEDESRASGWKVVFTGTPVAHRGDKVTVIGEAALDANQEAYIDASDVDVTSTGLIKPILMSNRHLGGNDSLEKPGVNTPLLDHLYNKGLLVTCVGKVTFVDAASDYFYIDDGSALDDGSGHIGVKVSWSLQAAGDLNPEIVPPLEDWYVTVIGISSSESPSEGTVIRALRPRRQEDIIVKVPEDTTDPIVLITDPSGTEILKLPGANSVQLAGTAVDTETGVAYVQVKIDGGAWQTASYNSTTHAWTYTWNNPSSTRIWVHAMDFAGHVTEIYRDVTVSAPVVIYVSKDGDNGNNGWTWATAKLTIQAALNTAWAESEPKVWVAAGTYNERIVLKSGLGLYGGFAGTESLLTERLAFPREATPDLMATVLDGQGAGNVVSAGTVNAYTTIDGFSIMNGGAYSGIYSSGSSAPSIANNTIQGNARGVYFPYATAIGWVHHNIIISNGTGVSCEGTAGSVVIENNHIDHNGNTAGRYGIGIRIANGASPTIERNWIEYNGSSSSGYDGGGIWCNSSTAYIYNNVIRGNVARNGGGAYITGISTVHMYNNTVVDNQAQPYQGSGGLGGAVYWYQSYVTMANNIFSNNAGTYVLYRQDQSAWQTVRSNCVYPANPIVYSDYVVVGSSINGNPYLGGADGVHLTASSTYCINTGDNQYIHGPTDIYGGERTLGSYVDVGAHEYAGP